MNDLLFSNYFNGLGFRYCLKDEDASRVVQLARKKVCSRQSGYSSHRHNGANGAKNPIRAKPFTITMGKAELASYGHPP